MRLVAYVCIYYMYTTTLHCNLARIHIDILYVLLLLWAATITGLDKAVYHRVYYRRVQNLQVLLCLLRQLFLLPRSTRPARSDVRGGSQTNLTTQNTRETTHFTNASQQGRHPYLGYEEGMESIRNPVRKLNHCNWISRHCLRVYNIYFRFPASKKTHTFTSESGD